MERVRGKVGDKGVIEARGLPREIKKSRGWSLPNWSCAGFISFVAASICILLDGSMLGLHDILCAFSFSCPACPCSRPSPAASPPPPLGRPRSPASAPSKKNCIPRTRTTLSEMGIYDGASSISLYWHRALAGIPHQQMVCCNIFHPMDPKWRPWRSLSIAFGQGVKCRQVSCKGVQPAPELRWRISHERCFGWVGPGQPSLP